MRPPALPSGVKPDKCPLLTPKALQRQKLGLLPTGPMAPVIAWLTECTLQGCVNGFVFLAMGHYQQRWSGARADDVRNLTYSEKRQRETEGHLLFISSVVLKNPELLLIFRSTTPF